ncbi:hypothetical protein Pla123a_05090 [Posidoniimonas polymericola]|uniref:Uncharacterized protein n=1 Tax=Posidoniimonas polymericola TaxID=2528002 RepID=A0A5C5ZEF5_9BACT|nr:hypothetical protein [Posidoniimonas polymericola]TWT85702.1 hypothetical protein Pla123a_05090 [Posidoniimonas polymericola]
MPGSSCSLDYRVSIEVHCDGQTFGFEDDVAEDVARVAQAAEWARCGGAAVSAIGLASQPYGHA